MTPDARPDVQPYVQQLFEAQSSTYTYLLADLEAKEAVLIDPVFEMVDRDLKLLEELGLRLIYTLETHIHADHITGSGEMRKRLGSHAGAPATASLPCADLQLNESSVLKFGRFEIRMLETPGHTDAALCFLCEDMVFTGDTLLIRGTGRTDFQSGSAKELYHSVTQKLFRLPALTRVYPGHDYKGFTWTTIAMEKQFNPRLGGDRTEAQFIKTMSELNLAYPKKMDESLPANLACGNLPHRGPPAAAKS